MKKKTKMKIGMIAAGVIVLCIAGYFVGKYYFVNYAFNNYVLNTALREIQNPEETAQPQETPLQETVQQGDDTAVATPDGGGSGQASAQQKPANDTQKSVDSMSKSEIAAIVSRSPELMGKLEGIVSYSDKERVIQILMSNFSSDEIAMYSQKVKKGMSSKEKSELISIARSRITTEQWNECIQLLYKYVDQIKPYING